MLNSGKCIYCNEILVESDKCKKHGLSFYEVFQIDDICEFEEKVIKIIEVDFSDDNSFLCIESIHRNDINKIFKGNLNELKKITTIS